MKKVKQVCWRDLTWIWRHLCACPLIDHGQQPMKMHTEVKKSSYCINSHNHTCLTSVVLSTMESTICLRKKSLYLNDTCDKAKLKWDRWSDDDESKNEQKCVLYRLKLKMIWMLWWCEWEISITKSYWFQ